MRLVVSQSAPEEATFPAGVIHGSVRSFDFKVEIQSGQVQVQGISNKQECPENSASTSLSWCWHENSMELKPTSVEFQDDPWDRRMSRVGKPESKSPGSVSREHVH